MSTNSGTEDPPDPIAPLMHELANLSNGLNLHGERLRMLLDMEDLAGARSAWPDVARESTRLLRLIEGVRKVEHMTGIAAPQPWSVPEVLTVAIAQLTAEGRLGGLDLHLTPPPEDLPRATCEPHALAGILQELLGNAVTAGSRRVRIEVEADFPHVRIDVVDDGGGISESMRPRMFTMFSSSLKHKGHLGLGLWRARVVAARIGGTLVCAGSEAGCTRFRLCLQQASSAQAS